MTISRRELLKLSAMAAAVMAGGHQSLAFAGQPEKPAAWPDSPFLTGNYGPVFEELSTEPLDVRGRLPDALDGLFVRNGPNPHFPPIGHYHWFDGDGMVHGVRLQGGQATYRNRWVRTDGWNKEREAGEALWGGLADPPTSGKKPGFKNAANTALAFHDQKLLALWEAGPPHELTVPELDTVGPVTFNGKLAHPFTAHPKLDPATGEMVFFGYQLFSPPYLQHSVVSREGTLQSTTAVTLPRPVMMHDFAVTEHHSLFLDLPQTFSLKRALTGKHPFSFEPELGARLGVLPRHAEGSQVRWFDIEPCYVFHTLSAWEEDGEVVLVGCRSERFPHFIQFGEDDDQKYGPQPDTPFLHQWRLNLETGRSSERRLIEQPVEFPRINEARMGRPVRYGYVMADGMNALHKVELTSGKMHTHAHGQGRLAGEGVFVPHPDAKKEDHGWLMTFVYDQATSKSELIVVDAQDFDSPPIARVMLPARVPYGFHGAWVPGDALS